MASIIGRTASTNGIEIQTRHWPAAEPWASLPSLGVRVAADPLVVKASTARFGAEALAEQVRVRVVARSITLPTLVLHGLDDGLVPASASEVFAGVEGIERRTYPGLRHELHNEPGGPDILDEVVAWIREHARIAG